MKPATPLRERQCERNSPLACRRRGPFCYAADSSLENACLVTCVGGVCGTQGRPPTFDVQPSPSHNSNTDGQAGNRAARSSAFGFDDLDDPVHPCAKTKPCQRPSPGNAQIASHHPKLPFGGERVCLGPAPCATEVGLAQRRPNSTLKRVRAAVVADWALLVSVGRREQGQRQSHKCLIRSQQGGDGEVCDEIGQGQLEQVR